jgi:selenocysteine-specific translation elongation factor
MATLRLTAAALVLAATAACAENDAPHTSAPNALLAAAADVSSDAGPFRMVAEDAFRIASGGVVVTGLIASGQIRKADRVCLPDGRDVEVLGIESFNRLLDAAAAGDRVGLLLSDITATDVNSGDELIGDCSAVES